MAIKYSIKERSRFVVERTEESGGRFAREILGEYRSKAEAEKARRAFTLLNDVEAKSQHP